MNVFKRIAYLVSTVAFSMLTLFAYAPTAGANSYFGGNWKLTFYSPVDYEDTAQEVYTVNADGSDLRLLGNEGATDDVQQSNPQWSPDMSNRQIAFNQDTDETTGEDFGLFIQDIDENGAPVGVATELSGGNEADVNEWDPSWSPDGETIAFHRQTDGDTGPNHIHTISSAGGTATAITEGDENRDTEPTWNKDGDTLVFTRTDNNGTPNDDTDDTRSIATVPADGTEADVELIAGSEDGGSPQWSPLTNTVVFQKDGELWTYTVGDSSAEQLSDGASIPFAPTYSPDGTIIAASGTDGIAYYNASTGEEIATVTIDSDESIGFDAANGIHEVDWARGDSPPNTEHECTTYVNTDCDEFDPEIPQPCESGTNASIISEADNGTPKYEDGFLYTPDKDYVGEDQYVYEYLDENMNAITCTVNITVLPKAPDTGAPPNNKGLLKGSLLAAGGLGAAYTLKKKRFQRR